MSKKLFGWTSSLKKSSKLATDAVVLDENQQNSGDSSDTIQSSALSVSPTTPEMRLSRQFGNEHNMSMVRTNDTVADPFHTPNNTLSLNNTQQNVYQFSHINGLHIGTNFQINNTIDPSTKRSSPATEPSERRPISVELQKTTSIDRECDLYTEFSFLFDASNVFSTITFSDDEIK